MITMNELVDLRMQQHIAHEIYRQQIMQRIPDPFPPMLPIPMPRHVIMPPRVSLPGVEMTLQNDELWKQFHQIGTEMIITKSGRRMFPSMRLSVSGLDEETNYCVLLEMVPIGDCRYKFSGSQWVPAGGAEPQSPQRMYLHPDSPATGAHWQAQPILFNKVKLTNNTLDNSGHIVLASMHKYQPRLHVIRTADLAQIPWAPQQAFVFAETEFVAVTAYQNDRITKLKIDNNPFAKGFRETGQSRCKRKMSSSPTDDDQDHHAQTSSGSLDMSPGKFTATARSGSASTSTSTSTSASALVEATSTATATAITLHNSEQDGPQIKRLRSNGSACSLSSSLDGAELPAAQFPVGASSIGSPPPPPPHQQATTSAFMQHFQQNMQSLLRPSLVDLACTYFGRPPHEYNGPTMTSTATSSPHLYGPTSILQAALPALPVLGLPHSFSVVDETTTDELELDVGSETTQTTSHSPLQQQQQQQQPTPEAPSKRKGFSISAILGGGS
ncbi:T-box transcription factor TBX6 isoform X1 [Drosophila sulfurigaster albostrigata]|uniref:T-box transcription factor TBX6 isoform X1 n=1 Tax=Drosophila sulfurigaster albostrigata TaxID=89887 RepID=UPI002D2197CC|nr:T-box transcription factor TBX6 isoform X1 [Drosophila sulfurigaster albostrigata]